MALKILNHSLRAFYVSLGKATRSRPHAFIAKRRPDDLVEFTIADLMTSSAAAAAILVLFDGSVFATIVIAFPFEIIRMAAGTKWRVL